MARRPPGRPRAATWVAIAAVAVLALVVGALSLAALQRSRPAVSDESAAPVPTPVAGPVEASPTPTPVAEPVEASPTPVPVFDRSTERFFSVASLAMWRGTAGACGGAEPLVERSTDGGRSWTDVTARYRQLAQLASLDAFTPTEGQLVAAVGPECQAQALRTFTQGQFWEPYANVLAQSSYIDPRDPSQVMTPAGVVTAPCSAATGLRAADGRLALICAGTAYTLSAQNTWQPVAVDDPVALAFSADGLIVAHAPAPTCAGLAVSVVVGADDPSALGCAADVDPSAGAVAIATDGDRVLVWAGETIEDVAP